MSKKVNSNQTQNITEKITLKNVLGYKEEKESIQKIITLLKDYDKYSKQGVNIPRGLIFQGPPGTGKTLLAKAIAGECAFKFFTAFNEDLQEENPLKTLKKIFKQAEKYSEENNTPSIVYIDELDKITYVNSQNDLIDEGARESTRFLLQKLDETKSKNKILIIASTNNYGKIPEALLRSGRFDKKILIDVPDLESREQILEYYINKNPLFKKINIKKLALKTKGMSGADLKTLINNTLVEYVTTKKEIEEDDFIKVINEMHFETIGKKWDTPSKLLEVLVHEVGHSVVSGVLTNNYGEINAIKYGEIGGATVFDDYYDEPIDYEEIEKTSNNVKSVYDKIMVAFGGMASEEVILHNKSIGVMSDIDMISGYIRFLQQNAVYGFDVCPTLHRGGERGADRRQKTYIKVCNKLYKETCKIIKKNMPLILYLIAEVHKHNDVLSQANVMLQVDFFNRHKKMISKDYSLKNIKKILTTIK